MKRILIILKYSLIITFLIQACVGCQDDYYDRVYKRAKLHNGDVVYDISFEKDGTAYSNRVLYEALGWTIEKDSFGREVLGELIEYPDVSIVITSNSLSSHTPNHIPLEVAKKHSMVATAQNEDPIWMRLNLVLKPEVGSVWEAGRKYRIGSRDPEVEMDFFGWLPRKSIGDEPIPDGCWRVTDGWISLRPLNDEFAFEWQFEFDATDNDGNAVVFRKGLMNSFYQGINRGARNSEIFTEQQS